MAFRNYREASRENWGSEGRLTNEELKIGALLRIADATEVMAHRHNELLADMERYKRYHKEAQASAKRLARSNAALRGVITKMKRREI